MRLRSNKPQKKHSYLRAQALVEFALLLPLLLGLILGAMDLGRVFYFKIVLTNAAREGANYLSRNPADYTNTLNAIITEGDSSGVTITADEVTWAGCCAVGEPVVITIEKKNVDLIFLRPITISSSVTMVVHP